MRKASENTVPMPIHLIILLMYKRELISDVLVKKVLLEAVLNETVKTVLINTSKNNTKRKCKKNMERNA